MVWLDADGRLCSRSRWTCGVIDYTGHILGDAADQRQRDGYGVIYHVVILVVHGFVLCLLVRPGVGQW